MAQIRVKLSFSSIISISPPHAVLLCFARKTRGGETFLYEKFGGRSNDNMSSSTAQVLKFDWDQYPI